MTRTLRTEEPHPAHPRLDRYDTAALVDAFVEDQAQAALAVRAAAAALAQAVDAAVPRLRAGGRIVYVGAGTSGRGSAPACPRTTSSAVVRLQTRRTPS